MSAVFPMAARLAGLLIVFAGGPAAAGDDAHAVERLSFANGQTGHRYRVSTLRPAAPPPADGYPVLFLLDGNAAEQDLVKTEALATPEGRSLALVTVGYDTDQRFDVAARAYDYTPALVPGANERDPLDATRRNGGADGFLAFIQATILPAVERQIPVNRRRLGLWGHSYGGLFVLHALQHADTFRCHIAASPSLWWRDGYLFKHRDAFRERLAGRRFGLLITRGSAETTRRPGNDEPRALARWRQTSSAPPNAAEEFAGSLQSLPGARIAYLELPGLSHGEAFAASLNPTLRWFSDCASANTISTSDDPKIR
jgi:predicted alpha/beta superfamily hydrolase